MPSPHRPIQFRLPWLRKREGTRADKIAQAVLKHSRLDIEDGRCPVCGKPFDDCEYFQRLDEN